MERQRYEDDWDNYEPEPKSHHPAPGDEWDAQRERDDNHKHDQSEY
jgi:hypothetical protein